MPEAGPGHLRDPDPRPLGRGSGARLVSVTWLASPTILLAPRTADTFMPGRHMRRASIGRFAPAVVSGHRGSQEVPARGSEDKQQPTVWLRAEAAVNGQCRG